jgi:glycosyltransferase involved in cell wall biosynthesis
MSHRILVVHNAYRRRGGEDAVVENEVALLQRKGHDVVLYRRDNNEIEKLNKAVLFAQTFWSRRSRRETHALIRAHRPDVIHVHNTFPLVSPSIYWAASAAGIPVVQTLHNYRLLCVQAMFLRNMRTCQDCLGKIPWRGAVRRCYRGSFVQSATAAGMLSGHRLAGTYRNKVARYIALSTHARDKFIRGGLPSGSVAVKPNFVDMAERVEGPRRGGLFVGRLSAEKGMAVLLAALDRLPGITLDVIGTGPEQNAVAAHPSVRHSGWIEREEVLHRMQGASYLVVPSICDEMFGLVVVEAFACGLPVIASRAGAVAELVRHGHAGLLFERGSADELAETIRWAETHSEEMRHLGVNARREYEKKYTPELNYRQLHAIYDEAIECTQRAGERGSFGLRPHR